jgi:hypothetical protein
MAKTRKIALALLLAVSLPAVACMGVLASTQVVAGGVVCTYRLSDGSHVRVMYPGEYSCPFCME